VDDPSSIELLSAGIVGGITIGVLYAATNAGLSALGEAHLHALAESEGPYARTARRARERTAAIRARLLLGRVLSVSIAASCAALLAQSAGTLAAIGAAGGAALAYALFAQLASTIARKRASRGAMRMLRWMRPLELLMAPVAIPIEGVGAAIARLVSEPKEQLELEARAVEHIIEQGEERGALAEGDAEMLRSVLEFRDTIAREVMVPRTKVVAFDVGTSLEQVLARIDESGHSRYPVFRGSLDNVEGILYAKDLFSVLQHGAGQPVSLAQLVRKPVLFAAETMKIRDVLAQMQLRRFHMTVIVDEFGGTGGIVTLEDIIEEIVGEIEDEHDESLIRITERAPGRYVVDATTSVYELEDVLPKELLETAAAENWDSLGGLVVGLSGRVPEIGEELAAGPIRLVVLDADERHVTQVEILQAHNVDTAGA